jgi:RNA polymerase sigma-70 factor (ECF subfamily)
MSAKGKGARAMPASQQQRQLESLARAYAPALKRYFEKRILEQADADDLVQEVFARLARRAELAAIDKVQGYLFETAANVLRDRIRRRAVRQAGAHIEYDDVAHGREEFTPERVLLGKAMLADLARAIEALPERTRTVFVLHRFEELSYAEIARRLGVSESAVEKHMMKAIAHLTKGRER